MVAFYYKLYGQNKVHNNAIYKVYASYVEKHYGSNSTVTFDGYDEKAMNTKAI